MAASAASASSNRRTGAEAFVHMLDRFGVEHVFGLCGDTSLPLYDALHRLDHGIEHVLTRDERSAAYMADGYARVSGRVGVCEGPSGGGATYILPGLVEAGESSIPVLAVTTDIAVGSRGRFTLTELDQEALFRPVTKWNAVIDRAADVPRMLRAAFRHMTTGTPGAAQLGLPFDVQRDPVDDAELHADPAFGRYPARRAAPNRDDVRAAAAAIRAAARPVFVCGGGVTISGAEIELRALAERLGAPVATTVSGKGAISDSHDLAVGVVGSNGGTPETRAVVDAADLVVFVGCRAGSVTTERWRHPAPGAVRVVHVDSCPGVVGVNYPTEAGLIGDAKLCLGALDAELAPSIPTPPARALDAAFVAARKREKYEAFLALARADDTPIRPERVVGELRPLLPEDAVVVADPGTPCPYLAAYCDFATAGRRFLSNRAHGALGYALPASVGVHYGRPGAKCVAVIGDGSFGFCAGELETLVRLAVPVTVVVIANGTFGWIKAGQKSGFDGRYYSVDFSITDHARVAAAYGLRTWRVTDPRDLRASLAAAIAHDGPTLVDVVCQPLHEARAPVSEWVA